MFMPVFKHKYKITKNYLDASYYLLFFSTLGKKIIDTLGDHALARKEIRESASKHSIYSSYKAL